MFGRTGLVAAICAAVIAFAAPPTSAQQQTANPVATHYRAFRAALEAGDQASAEREADAALQASEARDGEGGSTAALAFNLASLRLEMGLHAAALAPAQRAYDLARASLESGVDPVSARLALARAQLAAEGSDAAGAELHAAIIALREGDARADELYPAAAELGAWALRAERYDVAADAWSTATAFAEGALMDPDHGRAAARIGEGAVVFMRTLDHRLTDAAIAEAHAAFHEAKTLLGEDAAHDLSSGAMTTPQQILAQAMAWDGALSARVRGQGRQMPREPGEAEGDADGATEFGAALDERPRCLVSVDPPRIRYPRDAIQMQQVGAVVVRLRLDEAGNVLDDAVVARAGSDAFARALERVTGWEVARRDDSPAGCRMAMSLLIPVTFVVRGW